MIVKCHPTKPDKTDCPIIQYCLARLTDPTITGCGIPLYEAGLIRREDIQVEHTVMEVERYAEKRMGENNLRNLSRG